MRAAIIDETNTMETFEQREADFISSMGWIAPKAEE
jgi:hypothetical protein